MGLQQLLQEASRVVDGLRAFELASLLSRLHRIQGGSEVVVAAEHVAQLLGELGIEVRLEALQGPLGLYEYWGFWEPRGWRLYLAVLERRRSDGAWETVASSHETPLVAVVHSPPGSVEGEARLVGSPDSHQGEPVPVVSSLAWETYYRLVEGGAEAVIAFHEGPGVRYWGLYPPFFQEPPEAPAVSIEREKAIRLNRERVRIRVEAEYHTMPETPVLLARVGDDSGPTVLLTAHICHPSPGAHDNASGVAVLVEVMAALKAMESRLRDAGVSVIAVTAPEWTGLAAAFTQGLLEPSSIIAVLSIDMVGAHLGSTGGALHLIGSPLPLASPLDPVLDAAITASVEGPYTGLKSYEWGSDHDVAIGMGIPGSLLNEWPDRYYHTSLDTPDNLSPQRLAAIAGAIAGAVAALGERLEHAIEAAKASTSLYLYRALLSDMAVEGSAGEAAVKLAEYSRAYLDSIRRAVKNGEHEQPWGRDIDAAVRPPITRTYLYLRGGEAGKKILELGDRERSGVKAMMTIAAATGSMEIAKLYYQMKTGRQPSGELVELVERILAMGRG